MATTPMDNGDADWAGTLKSGRAILAALVFGELVFLGVVFAILNQQSQVAPSPAYRPLLFAGAALTITNLMLVPLMRRKLLIPDPTAGSTITPQAWMTATIISGALHESYGLLGVVACFVGRTMFPGIALTGLSILMILLLLFSARKPELPQTGRDPLRAPEKIG